MSDVKTRRAGLQSQLNTVIVVFPCVSYLALRIAGGHSDGSAARKWLGAPTHLGHVQLAGLGNGPTGNGKQTACTNATGSYATASLEIIRPLYFITNKCLRPIHMADLLGELHYDCTINNNLISC